MFLENGYATMKKHRSVSNRKIPRVHKRKMEEIHDKCDKGGAGSVMKKGDFEKAAGQNYDQRSDGGLRDQPHGVLLSLQGHLRSGGVVLPGGCDAGAAGEENV